MHREMKILLVPVLCLALAATSVSCRRGGDDTTAERTPPTTESPPATTTPAATAVRVSDVRLGRGVGADRRVTDETTQFRPQDTIYASVVTDGSASNVTLTARWTYQDGQQVDETSQTISPTGSQVTEFHISRPSGWPQGNYQVQILVNGTQATTRDFRVQ